MAKAEKIGDAAADAAADLLNIESKESWRDWAWRNTFPLLIGLIITGSVTWVTTMSEEHADAKQEFVSFQLETDYKFRRTEEALRTVAIENIALRNLVEEQQVAMALAAYKIEWLHPPQISTAPGDPMLPAVPVTPVDWDRLAEEMKKHFGGRSKVSPEDLERLLATKRPLYDQRQMPNMAPAGGR